jgi:hypothetical protein
MANLSATPTLLSPKVSVVTLTTIAALLSTGAVLHLVANFAA